MIKRLPKLFRGLRTLKGAYQIKLIPDAVPFVLTTPHRVPLPLLPKVKTELKQMEQLRVIYRIEEPISRCAGMVVAPKGHGNVRICVDLTKLNKAVCKERHLLPSVEQSLESLKNAAEIDANSGFWQIELDKASAILTTFITPFSRFHFNCLLFGVNSAPEHFQCRMSQI